MKGFVLVMQLILNTNDGVDVTMIEGAGVYPTLTACEKDMKAYMKISPSRNVAFCRGPATVTAGATDDGTTETKPKR